MNSDGLHRLKERGLDEMRRFLLMFVYLYVVFGLFVLNESLVLSERNLSFAPQGFALINAAVMAKVMLIAENLKLGRRFDHMPLIWPVAYKAACSPSSSCSSMPSSGSDSVWWRARPWPTACLTSAASPGRAS